MTKLLVPRSLGDYLEKGNYTAGVQSESPLISDLGEVAHW